jgi:hypothetical protein
MTADAYTAIGTIALAVVTVGAVVVSVSLAVQERQCSSCRRPTNSCRNGTTGDRARNRQPDFSSAAVATVPSAALPAARSRHE